MAAARIGRLSSAALLLILAAGCTSNRVARSDARPSPSDASGHPAPSPVATVREAVEALLSAEQRGNHAASYRLLSSRSRRTYRDVADWSRRRNELPKITGFSILDAAGDRATALVEHRPGLDPFVGLSPARERQTWRGRPERGGYLLDADPEVEVVLPPDDAAKPAAEAWASAVQGCDEAQARALQGVATLFGSSRGAASLCRSTGRVRAGAVTRLPPGPISSDIVAQYSTDALVWARVVALDADRASFHVILAPIADGWKVIGVFD
ncbi:MAG: hypothetical protein ACRDQ2_02560 [Gaiellales bacterium]